MAHPETRLPHLACAARGQRTGTQRSRNCRQSDQLLRHGIIGEAHRPTYCGRNLQPWMTMLTGSSCTGAIEATAAPIRAPNHTTWKRGTNFMVCQLPHVCQRHPHSTAAPVRQRVCSCASREDRGQLYILCQVLNQASSRLCRRVLEPFGSNVVLTRQLVGAAFQAAGPDCLKTRHSTFSSIVFPLCGS